MQPEAVNPGQGNGKDKVDMGSLRFGQKDCLGESVQARGSEGFSEDKGTGYEK